VTIIVTKKPGFPWLPILAVLIIAAAAAAYYFLVMKKEKIAKPTSLNLSSETTEIPADGRSTALVKIELNDESGEPIATPKDIQINLETSSGNITSPVVIKAEQTSSNATITSSVDIGVAQIKAESSGLRSASISLTFTEKRRYCMHCGAQMSLEDHVCPKCGQSPPSGVDVKECQNCGEVIPSVAKFCSECGARQPDAFENEDTEEEEDSGGNSTST
jgi:RNA polymerase subunit RPABC4/transcription elongation factor Spt4